MSASNFGWNAVATDSFIEDMVDITNQVRRVASGTFRTDSEVQRAISEINKLTNEGRKRLDQWTGQDLTKTFREAYKGDSAITLAKADSSWSARARSRFSKNGLSALNDIEQWGHSYVRSQKSSSDLRSLRNIISSSRRQLEQGGLSPSQRKKLQNNLAQAEALFPKVQQDVLKHSTQSPSLSPQVTTRRRKTTARGKRGTVAARRDADQYWDLLGKTGHVEMSNQGYIRGAAQRGVEWFLVSDGVECGWSHHRDTERANGKIVRREDIIPYAHPNCVRSFQELPDGPRGKKTQELIRQLTGIQSGSVRSALNKAAKYGAVLGAGVNVGGAFARNPLIREVIRDIINDPAIQLGSWIDDALQKWVNVYTRNEDALLTALGRPANVLSREQLRQETLTGVELKIAAQGMDGNDFTKIRISRNEMRVLGLKDTTVIRAELVDKLEDYADFVRHQQAIEGPGLQAVGAAAQDAEALLEMWKEEFIKMRATWMGRADATITNAKRINRILQDAIQKNPERAQVELIRSLAQSLDVLPWARARIGPVRFSVGIESRARGRLAKDLYLQFRGPEFVEIAYPDHFQRYGFKPLTQRLNAQYVYNSLLPRITFLGDPIHFSIFMRNGNIVPGFKMFPPGMAGRILSLEAHLRTEAISELLELLRRTPRSGWASVLREQLPRMGNDAIVALDTFRQGPIKFAARWQGTDLDSIAITMQPDGGWLRYNRTIWRGTVNAGRPDKRLVVLPSVNNGINLTPYFKQEAFEVLAGMTAIKGSMVEVARIFGFNYQKFMEDFRDMLQRYSITLEQWLNFIQGAYWQFRRQGLQTFLSAQELRAVFQSGYREAQKVPSLIKDPPKYPLDEAERVSMVRATFDPAYRYRGNEYIVRLKETGGYDKRAIDRRLLKFADSRITEDLKLVVAWYRRNEDVLGWRSFPEVLSAQTAEQLLGVDVVRREGTAMFWAGTHIRGDLQSAIRGFGRGRIVIPWEYEMDWGVISRLGEKMRDTNWWNPRAFGSEGFKTFMHELGHHWTAELGPEGLGRFWDATFMTRQIKARFTQDPPDIRAIMNVTGGSSRDRFQAGVEAVRQWMANPQVEQTIRSMVSGYAASDPMEMFAELFSEMATSQSPSLLARLGRSHIGLR